MRPQHSLSLQQQTLMNWPLGEGFDGLRLAGDLLMSGGHGSRLASDPHDTSRP